MISAARAILFSTIIFTGCRTAHDVAVTSFRVLDTPARFVRDRIDPPETTTTTTTTERYQSSDVTNPGQPVQSRPIEEPATHRRTSVQESREPAPAAGRRNTTASSTAQHRATPSPSPRAVVKQTAQFPTARPVPGQPGHVYSIDPKGGIVDVTGYKKGDKAKDPYTQQIFIVP
ncbi:MAG: hypothetical protein ACR2HH_03190 [Chthoniobacterales bacterium]